VIPGAIDVDAVSRRFVVRARESYTLKELLVEFGSRIANASSASGP